MGQAAETRESLDEDPREWSEPPTGQSLMHPTTVNADNTTKNEDDNKK